jgi:hypothetical protein
MRLVSRTGLIATSFAVAAIAVPSASANPSAQLSPWAGPLAFASSQAPPSTPGPLAGPLAFQGGSSGSVKVTPTVVRVTEPSNSFDYGDAAVGAGVMAGLTLLGAAGALTVRRRGALRHP